MVIFKPGANSNPDPAANPVQIWILTFVSGQFVAQLSDRFEAGAEVALFALADGWENRGRQIGSRRLGNIRHD